MSSADLNQTDFDFDWGYFCYKNPSSTLCENVRSYYEYRIWLAPNALFIALFGLSLIGYLGVYAATRRGLAFTFAMASGVVLEILGYVGRIMSYHNQWDENGFLMQICCLTIGPAFMAGGIYLCLRRIVYAFGPENSRLKPEWYTRIFIPCDVISLVLQATGGGMASVASHRGESVETGDNIMIAGLSFQVLTLLVFMAFSADFAFNTWKRYKRLGAAALDQDDDVRKTRNSFKFRGFIAALALATISIFWRSVFRVAELSRGWDGPLMKRQDLFVGFEGVMVVVAALALNIFHPNVCFAAMMASDKGSFGGCFGRRRKAAKKDTAASAKAAENSSRSGNVSDAEGKAN